MEACKNESSGTWHLLGRRGCGASPGGETLEGSWALLRDQIERDEGSQCGNCQWPPAR